mmetsp:Transcript_13334/g.19618  ORF Transcript_13334/g.19618 Transcript_13334/m.19618 type:complete len:96 (+) Transcript_13334:69-356(+)
MKSSSSCFGLPAIISIIMILLATIVAATSSSAETKMTRSSSSVFDDKHRFLEGMGPGMKQKMSFMAVATSQIQDPSTKAAMLKEFQKVFQQGKMK